MSLYFAGCETENGSRERACTWYEVLNKMNTRVRQLEAQVHEFQLKRMQQTQVNLFFLNAIFYLKSKYLIQFASSPHDWL